MQELDTNAGEPKTWLRRDKLNDLRKANGIQTEAELARIIGVSPETLWRVSTRKQPASGDFIARALIAFPHASFEVLFEVTANKPVAAVA
ncbi:helix-turn-helix transcriptional regulator [Microbacterium sp. CFH 90308]|uniref:Helix-turn-helix transcriptional regulator n=1 Tax=Microbacterium salsuginis TaxID=2722803 RepID=A0ABX1K6G6_9MICO|nr:helix-turn-helix transcriptional regulator [Microbacterium sp. CFH 90308]NLP82606.1 helix-turn-helix transcriptional regulator [Microbacterium sp. CFH 90308]